MRRDDFVDFFAVEAHQIPMHDRLLNWARYVDGKGAAWMQAAIWKMGKSNGRQWHEPVMKPAVNTLDGHDIEKAVRDLPDQHRDALRWYYVKPVNPSHMRRHLGVTDAGLLRLIKDGRSMLINRRV